MSSKRVESTQLVQAPIQTERQHFVQAVIVIENEYVEILRDESDEQQRTLGEQCEKESLEQKRRRRADLNDT